MATLTKVEEKVFIAFAKEFKEQMQRTEHAQGAPYHFEGDVWSHTMLVLKHYLDSTPSEKRDIALFISCLLHDVGKAKTLKVEKDENGKEVKRTFYGHEGMSVYDSLSFLKRLRGEGVINNDQMIEILYLVNYHDLYKFSTKLHKMFSQEDKELLKKLLKISECDLGGNLCKEGNGKDVFGDFNINTLEPLALTNDSSQKEAIIMVGAPLSGKSTYISQINKDGKYEVLSRDDIIMSYGTGKYGSLTYNKLWERFTSEDWNEVNALFDSLIREHTKVSSAKDVIFDLTNMSIKARRRLFSYLPKGKYRVKAAVFLIEEEELLKRNKKRVGKEIPLEVLRQMQASLKLPLRKEGFEEISFHF
jgi:predicted kinase